MNPGMPLQRFQKKRMKPKVLVMGHSWVKDIEEEHLRNPITLYDLEFAYEEGIRISGLIDMIPRVMASYHTHILLFSVLPDALTFYSVDNQNPAASQYRVLGPNKDFNPEYFAHQMNIFTEHCKVINPKVKIVLMIPPVTDLVFHNQMRVNYYPYKIQNAYRANPQFDEHLLYMCMKDLFATIMLLKSNQCMWMEKTVYPLQIVAQAISIIRTPLGRFMKGDIYTMGETSHLRDGFHPNALFIEKMWGKLKVTGLLHLDPSTPNSRVPISERLQGRITVANNSSPISPQKNKSSAGLKGILKKKKLNTSPKTDSNSPVSILKRPIGNKTLNSNPIPVKNFAVDILTSTVNNTEIKTEVKKEHINDKNDSVDFISQKTLSTTPKPRQLVNASYMNQEIEKFASFMAGHAHAVGQNLSLREVKKMMMDVLQEQV